MSNAGTVEKTLQRSGSTIHYWLTGPENGRLVTFTPGASMDHRMFDEQVSVVASAGYRVLTWDVRGHGLSKPIGEGFSLPAVVEDLLALMDLSGHEKAVFVGQSFGGYVAQETLFRYPDRVEALALIGSTNITVLPSRLEYWALKLSPIMFRLWPWGNLRKQIAKNTALKPEVRSYAHAATGMLSKEEFVAVWKAVADALHEEPGYRIERPLLLTHGEYDRMGIVAKTAPEWAGREPDCRYEVVPGASHNANQDNPAFFNRLLLEFLEQRAPALA
jgi:pimeloyl-ACP methyl ester carboxylesterase